MSGSGPARELTRNRKVDAALQNEFVTRQRVDALEVALPSLFALRLDVDALRGVVGRGFWGRLRWLLMGR